MVRVVRGALYGGWWQVLTSPEMIDRMHVNTHSFWSHITLSTQHCLQGGVNPTISSKQVPTLQTMHCDEWRMRGVKGEGDLLFERTLVVRYRTKLQHHR